MQRKGEIGLEGIFYALAFIFATAILVFVLYHVFTQVDEPFNEALSSAVPTGETSFNVTSFNNKTLAGVGTFNSLFPFLIFGLILMTVVSAFFIESNPVFFFIMIIVLGVVILLGMMYSNIYQQITEDDSFGDTGDNFTVMNLFLKYLPFVIGLIALITMIILFSKRGGNSGGL